MELWQAIILAIVEGLTEYLPISSTGHLILTSAFLGINESAFVKDFTVMVQFGAILSVLVLYWRRFLQGIPIYIKLSVAFLPAAIVGLLVKDHIDEILGNVVVVAWAFIIGGVVLIAADLWLKRLEKINSLPAVDLTRSFGIGFAQCLAFIPGVSRSAASILGGLTLGLDRKTAAEFSFLLAVPTLSAASLFKLRKILPTIEPSQVSSLLIGNVVSFVVGAITIKLFIGYLSRHGFWVFGIYRIIVGVVILLWLASGRTLNMI